VRDQKEIWHEFERQAKTRIYKLIAIKRLPIPPKVPPKSTCVPHASFLLLHISRKGYKLL
jgi:hypothetical protein